MGLFWGPFWPSRWLKPVLKFLLSRPRADQEHSFWAKTSLEFFLGPKRCRSRAFFSALEAPRRPREGSQKAKNVDFPLENVGVQRFRGKSSLAAKSGPTAPKRAPTGPTGSPKGGPREDQERPKRGPRGSKMGPKMAPKGLPGGPPEPRPAIESFRGHFGTH